MAYTENWSLTYAKGQEEYFIVGGKRSLLPPVYDNQGGLIGVLDINGEVVDTEALFGAALRYTLGNLLGGLLQESGCGVRGALADDARGRLGEAEVGTLENFVSRMTGAGDTGAVSRMLGLMIGRTP